MIWGHHSRRLIPACCWHWRVAWKTSTAHSTRRRRRLMRMGSSWASASPRGRCRGGHCWPRGCYTCRRGHPWWVADMMGVPTTSPSVEVWDLIVWWGRLHKGCLTRESRKSWDPGPPNGPRRRSKVAGGVYHRNHWWIFVCLVFLEKPVKLIARECPLFFSVRNTLNCEGGQCIAAAHSSRVALLRKGASWRACATPVPARNFPAHALPHHPCNSAFIQTL